MASNTPKSMSSRLMTMKFMQRSAAKSTASSPSTPNGPPSKKARLSNGASAPGTSDHEILQSALAAEEKKRQEALDKAAQYTGETKWALSFKDPLEGKQDTGLKVRQAGFAEIDAEGDSEDDEEETKPVRKQFGGGVKRAEKPIAFEQAEDSEGEIDSNSEDYDSDDPTAALIRETKREVAAERRAARETKSRQDDTSSRGLRRPTNGDDSLRGVRSISGVGPPGGREQSGRDMRNVECHKCGQKGHMAATCTKPRGSTGRGRGRGRR